MRVMRMRGGPLLSAWNIPQSRVPSLLASFHEARQMFWKSLSLHLDYAPCQGQYERDCFLDAFPAQSLVGSFFAGKDFHPSLQASPAEVPAKRA